MSKWIKKGDKVVVIAGNDRGKTGEVIARKADRVIVQGVNIRKKHAKRRTQTGAGEIHEFESPIHVSNVGFCTPSGKRAKPRLRITDKGKELFIVDGDEEIILRSIKSYV